MYVEAVAFALFLGGFRMYTKRGMALILAALGATSVTMGSVVATYLFDGDLSAFESGPPSLTAVDPYGLNSFSTDFIYSATRTTYVTEGDAGDDGFGGSLNAGVTLDTTGLAAADEYSVDMVVKFDETDGTWRKLIDVYGMDEDNGFYISPSGYLQLWNSGTNPSGTSYLSPDTYYHLALTVASNGTVKAYLDGGEEVSLTGSSAFVRSDPTMTFFLDEVNTGHLEYTDVTVGLIRFWDHALSSGEVASLAADPYAIVPEPASLLALGLGAAALLRRKRR